MSPLGQRTRNIAVLPIDDDELFRHERVIVRTQLYNALRVRVAPHKLLSLAKVDQQLLPVSQKSGERCAFQMPNHRRRARQQGWATSGVSNVFGMSGSPSEIWVRIGVDGHTLAIFAAPEPLKVSPLERYRQVFSRMTAKPNVGVLGGMSVKDDTTKFVKNGNVSLCEERHSRCNKAASLLWKDALPAMNACFAKRDASVQMLIEAAGPRRQCEIANLKELSGRMGQLEKCLCGSLLKSPAFVASAERRSLRITQADERYAGRPRPQLRAIETTTNMRPQLKWHRLGKDKAGKQRAPVRVSYVENLESLIAPLSLCDAPAGRLMVADLIVSERGTVNDARLVDAARARRTSPLGKCVRKALRSGAFNCTDGGNSARVRVSIEWPAAAAKP